MTDSATKAGDLLPCPFCGSKTLYVKHEPKTILHPAYYVHCDDCGAQSGAWERGEHIEEWNRRAAAPAESALASDAMVRHMVNRFLGWRLPKPWRPDNGISYERPNYAHPPAEHDWPVGTNLFDAQQAESMIRYMLEGVPFAAEKLGIERAANWVRDRRWDHEREHGYIEPDTNALSYGTGPRAIAKEEYNCELCEIEEGIRALAAASVHPNAESASAAPADAIGLLRRCSSWLALMNSGKEGDGHVFDKLRRDLHAFLFQRPNPTPSASDTEPASARRLIAKYDDAFALASRPQPARGDCSTSMLALLREIRDELAGDVDYCSETGGNKAARLIAAIDMEIHRATGEITA